MNDFFAHFTPKKLLRVIGEFFSLSLKGFFKYWPISFLVVALLITSILYFDLLDVFELTNSWVWIGIFILSSFPGFFTLYHKGNRVHINPESANIAISEPLMIYDKEYINTNIDSHKIANQLRNLFIQLAKNKFPFSIGLIKSLAIEKPKLFYVLNDLNSLRGYYSKLIKKGKFLSILLITRDIENKKIEFDIIYNEDVLKRSGSTIDNFKGAFNRTVENDWQYDQYIIEVSKVFVAIQGQASLDILIHIGKFEYGHRVVDDCESLFLQSMNKISKIINPASIESFQELKSSLLCNFTRYRSILYLNQGEYRGAIKQLFKAARIHPYFPYSNYRQYKEAFEKMYIAGVARQTAKFRAVLEDEIDEAHNTEAQQELIENSESLLESLEFQDTPFFEHIFLEISRRADSKEINDEIEKNLKEDFCASPIKEIIRAEVLKYLPKGTEKHDALYLERLPEVINDLKVALEKDQDFPLLYSRIGILMFIQAAYEQNDAIKNSIWDESMKYMLEGKELYSRLGNDNKTQST